jgi:hypothetical protein
MELNDLYDHLWNTGTLLQSEDACSVLENDYRPWPRVRYTEGASRHYYDHLEKSKPAALMELKQYENKSDVAVYTPILLEVLQLFGLAIHTSLESTMGKYLKATDGIFRNELRPDWQLEMVSKLLCTNNPAERPFAVAKGICYVLFLYCQLLLRPYPSLPCYSIYENIPDAKSPHTCGI